MGKRVGKMRESTYLGQGSDEVVDVGLPGCVGDLLVCSVVVAAEPHGDVVADGALVEDRLLLHERDVAAVFPRAEVDERGAVAGDAAGGGVVEALEQGDGRALSAAARADEGDELSWLDVDVDVLEDLGVGARRVGEVDVVDVHVGGVF